ncbi:MAG TPA: nitrate/nitrite transporter NrtS [Ktedonobacterales bacterium]|jgi:hypothetical protein
MTTPLHHISTNKILSLPRAWRSALAYCLERDTLARSLKTALVVGTILALINHGQQLLLGQFAPSWVVPMLVTYLVPFSVATYGQVQGKRQRDRLLAASRAAGGASQVDGMVLGSVAGASTPLRQEQP